MEYEYIKALKASNPALRVINAESAPLILSFFHKVFVEPNRRSIPHQELLSLLEDELFQLHEIYGEDVHKMSAKQHLAVWYDNNAYLSSVTSIVATSQSTPSVAKALEWISDLKPEWR